ncbi:MAG: DUF3606 domain-containing protein [Pseudomonadota bacterium]
MGLFSWACPCSSFQGPHHGCSLVCDHHPPAQVDPTDPSNLAHWRDEFGVTLEQLTEAVEAVGGDPEAIRQHFLDTGSSAGAS